MEHSRPRVAPSEQPDLPRQAGGDAEDAALAARGDAQAFERLYRNHVSRIHSLARRMMGADAAAEATQDVFVRAWEKLGTFRGEAAFGTWLYRLAINLILSRRARLATQRSREVEGETMFELIPARSPSVGARLDFDRAIGRLPDGARQVFVMHDVEGFKHEEIATMLGVAVGTSKAQLHRARMLLRRALGQPTTA